MQARPGASWAALQEAQRYAGQALAVHWLSAEAFSASCRGLFR
ncbi:hypothetical protein [Atopomonas sediminilitoris]